jgi:hypothetical protein
MLVAVPAFADDVAPAKEGSPPPPPPALPRPDRDTTSHKGMFAISLRTAIGMRAIVSYDKTDYCGATDASTTTGNAPVCSGRAPFSFDIELGYGIARRIDLFAELRLGLETDFHQTAQASDDGPRMLHISPGARFFFSDAKSSKLFTTAQLVFDFAGYKDAAGEDRGSDFGVRNMNGLWFDLEKAYGFYVYLGETATFSRWLRFELELGVGFQGRYR